MSSVNWLINCFLIASVMVCKSCASRSLARSFWPILKASIVADLHVLNDNIINNLQQNQVNADKDRVGAVSDEPLTELMKLGWSIEEAIAALELSSGDITSAAAILEDQHEYNSILDELSLNISVSHGWNQEATRMALRECNMTVDAALVHLQNEEDKIIFNFENNLFDMIESGWDEMIARKALIAQWELDQQKFLGFNTTAPRVPRELLEQMRPTLKINTSNAVTPSLESLGQGFVRDGILHGLGKGNNNLIPNNNDAVVFDVNSTNFQKLVLECPIPVLLDVYADWCGPCKQLGPVLEEVVSKANGMFRLAKLNADKDKELVDILGVKALPTVFAISRGKLNDRFEGIIEGKNLQSFIIRLVSGVGMRHSRELSDSELKQMSRNLGNFAGLSSIGHKKKDRLCRLVEEALILPGGFVGDAEGKRAVPHQTIKIALKYISNAATDPHNKEYSVLKKTSKTVFSVISSPAGRKLLEAAGFREIACGDFELLHKNAAILNIVHNKASQYLHEVKHSAPPVPHPVAVSNNLIPNIPFESELKKLTEDSDNYNDQEKVIVSFRGRYVESGPIIEKSVSCIKTTSLIEAMRLLSISWNDLSGFQLLLKYPLPQRLLSPVSSELERSLGDFAIGKDGIISLTTIASPPAPDKLLRKLKVPSTKRNKKINTLSSMGILSHESKSYNEYFGGDSTVTTGYNDE